MCFRTTAIDYSPFMGFHPNWGYKYSHPRGNWKPSLEGCACTVLHGNRKCRSGSACLCSYISMFVASSLRMRTDNTEPPFFFIDVRARVEGRNNAETGSKGAFTVFTRLCSLHRCPRACGRSFFLYRLVQRLASEINAETGSKGAFTVFTRLLQLH